MEWRQQGYKVVTSNNVVASANKTVSENEFESIISSHKIVLVDFYASWCAPCKKMSPIIDEIKMEYKSNIAVEKIDIEANPALHKTYDIGSIPGFLLFVNGKETWRHNGTINKEELTAVIKKHL